MGVSDWRAKHNMRDPVRGVFRVTGFYDKHPSSSPPGTRVTGVITAPGIPATPAEHKVDERGRWASHQQLPVLVDRSDPSRFAILWSEVQNVSWRDSEMSSAQAMADQLNTAQPGFQPYVEQTPFPGPPGYQPGYPGQVQIPVTSLPPDAAAAVQAAVAQALRAAGPGQQQVLGAPGRATSRSRRGCPRPPPGRRTSRWRSGGPTGAATPRSPGSASPRPSAGGG
jgi:hypothetical protein